MPSAVSIVFALHLAQAAVALVFTGVVLRFAETYHRRYLADWAASWGTWAVYHGCSGAAFLLSMSGAGQAGQASRRDKAQAAARLGMRASLP